MVQIRRQNNSTNNNRLFYDDEQFKTDDYKCMHKAMNTAVNRSPSCCLQHQNDPDLQKKISQSKNKDQNQMGTTIERRNSTEFLQVNR